MKNQKKQKRGKKDNIIILVLKKVKLSSLILLAISLCCNAYAWFIYATKASTGIEAYVTSWNVSFEAGDEDLTTNIKIDIEEIFPGMETWTREVGVVNKGETAATLEYSINSITVLGEKYSIGIDGITKEDIMNKIDEFPFKIEIITEQGNLDQQNGTGKFIIQVSWDFESGNDELDTMWGQKAYSFKEEHPNESCIHMDVMLKAVQVTQ